MYQRSKLLNGLLWLSAGVVVGWSTSKWVSWARKQVSQWLWPMGPLALSRPLVTFDIEATGTNVTLDKIVEIAALKLMPDGTVLIKGPQRLNPGIRMSEEVIAIHGITNDDVADCPRFDAVAEEWQQFLAGCDLHGYNAKKFDVPILRNEFKRCGVLNFPELGVPVVDSFRLFCLNEPRTLGAAVAFYCGRSHAGAAHTALADADASLRVLVEQVRRYPSLPRSVADLAALCAAPSRAQDITGDGKFQWRGDIPVLGFGKFAGEPLAAVMSLHKDYLRWMSGQDFSDEALIVVAQALKGLLPTKAGGWEPLVFEQQQQQQQQGPGGQAADTKQQRRAAAAATPAEGSSSSSKAEETADSPATSMQQQQQQQGSDGGSTTINEAVQQQEQQQQQRQEEKRGEPATAAAAGLGAGGSSSSSSSSTAPPAASGWPELDPLASSGPAANPDSWGHVSAAPESCSSPDSDSPAGNGSSSPNTGGGADNGGWSIVEASPQEPASPEPSNPEPSNPEPQHAEVEEVAGSTAASS